jgi:hypothetical protein
MLKMSLKSKVQEIKQNKLKTVLAHVYEKKRINSSRGPNTEFYRTIRILFNVKSLPVILSR